MPHVQTAARIGEHLEAIEVVFRRGRAAIDFVAAVRLPIRLRFVLHLNRKIGGYP